MSTKNNWNFPWRPPGAEGSGFDTGECNGYVLWRNRQDWPLTKSHQLQLRDRNDKHKWWLWRSGMYAASRRRTADSADSMLRGRSIWNGYDTQPQVKKVARSFLIRMPRIESLWILMAKTCRSRKALRRNWELAVDHAKIQYHGHRRSTQDPQPRYSSCKVYLSPGRKRNFQDCGYWNSNSEHIRRRDLCSTSSANCTWTFLSSSRKMYLTNLRWKERGKVKWPPISMTGTIYIYILSAIFKGLSIRRRKNRESALAFGFQYNPPQEEVIEIDLDTSSVLNK